MTDTITCPRCSTPNPSTSHFCAKCGEALPVVSQISQPPSVATLRTGIVLKERYRIVSQLGKGGFGAVYKAWDTSLTRPCAIKENLDTSPEAQRQFTREAQVLANLSHPNLPRVTDHFFIPEQGQYLVMDYIEGEDLQSLVKRQGAILPSQAIPWIAQVADALQYLHSRQPPILHRDIKPANIRLTPEGRIFLVDFGLVKEYAPDKATTLGARAVTPGYSPPEQYGAGTTDERADIYALGATLYALLTGAKPPESISRITQDTLVAPQQINAQISPAVGQVISHAMSLQPDRRYRNVADFKNELTGQPPPVPPINTTVVAQEYREQPTVQAGSAPPSELPPQKRSLSRYWPAGALVLLILICGISAIWAWHEYGPNSQAVAPPFETSTLTATAEETTEVMVNITLTQTNTHVNPLPSPTDSPIPEATQTSPPSPTYTDTPMPTSTPAAALDYDLAFASDRSGVVQIYLADSQNTANWLAISNPAGYIRVWWPSFCGNQIGVEAQDLSGTNPTWIFLLDSENDSATRWMPPDDPPRLAVPRCSPDHSLMAYSSRISDGWELVIFDISSNQITPVYTSAIAGYTTWPLEGETVYSMAKPETGFEIIQTDNYLDPSSIQSTSILTDAKFPALSPGGDQLTYICSGTSAICVMDLESGESTKVHTLNYVRVDDTPMPASVAWSADGVWLYFASADGGDWDIFRMRPDGSDVQNLTPDWPSNELMPALRW